MAELQRGWLNLNQGLYTCVAFTDTDELQDLPSNLLSVLTRLCIERAIAASSLGAIETGFCFSI